MPQLLRDARIAAIYEGTNGIQAMDLVGRKVAGDNGVAVRELIAVIGSTGADLAEVRDADVQAIWRRLARAATHLTGATDWLLECYPREPGRVSTGPCSICGCLVTSWAAG